MIYVIDQNLQQFPLGIVGLLFRYSDRVNISPGSSRDVSTLAF